MVTKTEYGFIMPKRLEEEMRSSYMDYALSVIVARALPDVRDGLKPVQRRILYAMQGLGMRSNSSYKKSARLVGEVLGKYHPHGDGPVYDAMVRMAQDFSMRVPLVDGQGNFGSIDNDPPAAMRYTEARLSSPAEEMLANLDEETVDFVDNFDASLQEPMLLPARLPNLLLNGASGIAVGMATNIPPHNLSELCDAIYLLLRNPEPMTSELMRRVHGPDFPTGATIMGSEGIQEAYETGRGQIVVRGTATIEPMNRSGRMQIVVTELPYQVNKATLIEKIAGLVKSKRLEGISEIRDESDRKGMRIVMELRSGAQGLVILNKLYKLTAMQSTFSANMLALVDGTPMVITLRDALLEFIEFRRVVIRRRAQFQLRKAKERSHILEGLRIALANLDSVIALIRNAPDAETAKTQLMEWYDLSDVQAQAILDMQLRRIAALERERIESEYKELQATIRSLEELLDDPEKVDAEIKKETMALKKKHGSERRTIIGEDARNFRREDLEPHEQIVITLSQGGYVKRIPASTYRNQHRGGKGVVSMATREDDPVEHILVGDTHDTLLFFTNTGRVLPLRSYELRADTTRNSRGVPVVNVIPLTDREHVNAVVAVPDLGVEGRYLVLATRKGLVKRGHGRPDFHSSSGRTHHHEPPGQRRAGYGAPGHRGRRRDDGHPAGAVHPVRAIGHHSSPEGGRRREGHGSAPKGRRYRDGRGRPEQQAPRHQQKGLRKADGPQSVQGPGARRTGCQDAEGHQEDRTGRRRTGDYRKRRAVRGLVQGQGAQDEPVRDSQHGQGGAGSHDIQAGPGRLRGLDSVRRRVGDSRLRYWRGQGVLQRQAQRQHPRQRIDRSPTTDYLR